MSEEEALVVTKTSYLRKLITEITLEICAKIISWEVTKARKEVWAKVKLVDTQLSLKMSGLNYRMMRNRMI